MCTHAENGPTWVTAADKVPHWTLGRLLASLDGPSGVHALGCLHPPELLRRMIILLAFVHTTGATLPQAVLLVHPPLLLLQALLLLVHVELVPLRPAHVQQSLAMILPSIRTAPPPLTGLVTLSEGAVSSSHAGYLDGATILLISRWWGRLVYGAWLGHRVACVLKFIILLKDRGGIWENCTAISRIGSVLLTSRPLVQDSIYYR